MVETPRKRKTTDLSIDKVLDRKRRTRQPRLALPMASIVEDRSADNVEEDEDDEGLPSIRFLPRVVCTQLQRNTNITESSHNGASPTDQSVLELSSPTSEQQQQQPIYVVEEESNFFVTKLMCKFCI